MRRLLPLLLLLGPLTACDDADTAPADTAPADAAPADAAPADTAPPDAAPADAGPDAGPSDAAPDAEPDAEPEPTEGLAPAEATGGPAVVWDPDARPLPDIPLPNDALTRRDRRTPTGRRVDIALTGTTAHENAVRAAFNEMDGFGAFAPLYVSFDRRLDLADIIARHATDDFRDDALYLLNVDPDCRRFGEEVALDLGRGRYPVTVYRRAGRDADPAAPGGFRLGGGNAYFAFDAMGEANTLLFPEVDEDSNRDGILQPEEDTDGDGILDEANLWPPDACDAHAIGTRARDRCVADHLLDWYEYQTETLILRPVWPLEQQCTYAVVLTERLRGLDGAPIRSPLPFVNLPRQTEDLRPIVDLLPRYGLGLDDVAFAWTMTVGSHTRDLEALRAGLYGHGPFARLADEFPAAWTLWTRADLGGDRGDDRALIPGACAGAGLTYLWQHGIGEWDPNMCALEADNSAIGGVFGGTFEAPYLLADGDGIATPSHPADDDERWRIDVDAGTAEYGRGAVTFFCALPREDPAADCAPGNPDGVPFCKPFPTMIFAHGYGSSRAEITSHMGRHTAMGHAICAPDAPGHGLQRWKVDLAAGAALIGARFGFSRYGVPEMAEIIVRGRDRDLNNDGLPDGGADQWTADLFHTRDMVRQSALEIMQLVRILRAMDGREGPQGVLGDVDGDGTVDLGGPQTTLGMWGISLGGIVAGVLAGAEPSLDAVSPNAGGAGLVDIATRSSLGGLPDAIILPMMGPIIAGCLPVDGSQNPLPPDAMTEQDCMGGGAGDAIRGDTLTLGAFVTELADQKTRVIGRVEGVRPGDRVELRNLRSGEVARGRINARGWFRLGVAADALEAVERRPLLGLGAGARVVEFADTPQLGDRLALTIYVGDSETVRATVDTFGRDVTHFATRYPEGAPLVALARGLGYARNTPGFRRFLGIAQHAIGPADPGVWAAHAVLEPLDFGYDPHRPSGNTRVLYMPVVGDRVVPVNTGVAMARAAGVLGSWHRDQAISAEHGWRELFVPDPRYGKSVDQELIDRFVVEGDHRFQRYADNPINPSALYDIDDLSDGAASFSCGPSDWSGGNGEFECPDEFEDQEVWFSPPRPDPGDALRIDRRRDGPDGRERYDAFRVPLVRPAGQHGIYNAQPFRVFDHDAYTVDLTLRFLATGGGRAGHEPGCDCTATGLPAFTLDGAPSHPSFDRACLPDELKLCDPACAAAWGIRTPVEAACVTE